MNISPSSLSNPPAPPLTTTGSTQPAAMEKLKESCRQFEAVLWRSVLEKSNSLQSGGEAGESPSCDKTGTYQYFINDTIATSVSGLPSSFSSILFASLSPHVARGAQPTEPS